MPASKIMIIRHGEKQKDFPNDPDIDRNGQPDPASLNSQGWRRAKALAMFFSDPKAPGIARPDMIFAARPNAGSQRPMQTVTPLAETLWPNPAARAAHFGTTHDVDDLAGLIKAATDVQGTALISWEHRRIPDIAELLDPAPAAPARWPGRRFDVVWIFDRRDETWAFSQTPQNVLTTDQNKPIKDTDD